MTPSDDISADDAGRIRLRGRIAADIRPVRPLNRPSARAAALAAIGLGLLVALPLAVFHVRTDVDRLSPLVTWGASVAQLGVGLALAAFACRQVVPGHWSSVRTAVGWLGIGTAAVCAVMAATWWASPVRMPAGFRVEGAYGCFRQSFRYGLLVLVPGLVLAARGFPSRPALVGGLVGLAAGVMADAAWRMVCVVTEPSHVLTGHLGAVVALSLAGSVLLSAWTRLTSPSSLAPRP